MKMLKATKVIKSGVIAAAIAGALMFCGAPNAAWAEELGADAGANTTTENAAVLQNETSPDASITDNEIDTQASGQQGEQPQSSNVSDTPASVSSGLTLSVPTLTSLASWDYSGTCTCIFRFKDNDPNDYVFYVTIAGYEYEGYCLDHGRPAPANGVYDYDAYWNGINYYIVVDTEDAPMHPSQIDVGQGCQRVGGFTIDVTGSFALHKTATCDTPYPVTGAVYGLYWHYADAQALSTPDYYLTISEDGWSQRVYGLQPARDWYVREITAPYGYVLDDTIYQVEVEPWTVSDGSSFEVTDNPINDPASVQISKEVDNPQQSGEMGESTLALAEYTFDYYATTQYETLADLQASGIAKTRSWVLRTDEDGWTSLYAGDLSFEYDSQTYTYKVSGDDFYRAQFGTITLPLGTIVVYESQAPEGFELSEQIFFARLVQDGNGFKWISEDVFTDPQQPLPTLKAKETQKQYGVEINKTIEGVENEASPQGIQFEVVNSAGNVVLTLTLDEFGHAQSAVDALVYDTYTVREVESSLPKNAAGEYLILPWSWTSGTGSNVVATFTCKDYEPETLITISATDYYSEHATGKKLDSETSDGVPETEFTLWKLDGVDVVSGAIALDEKTISVDDPRWVKFDVVWSDEKGAFDFGYLPYGIYKMNETHTNEEYMTSAESAGLELDTNTSRIFKLDVNNPYTEQVWLNKRIVIECDVDKSTIEVTSAAHEYQTSSQDGQSVSNVGIEEYKYEVAFSNGQTNTYSDEFWVVDELNFVDAPYDLRITKLWLPVVQNDTDGKVWLLWKTNLTMSGNVPENLSFAQPELHTGSLCDGTMRFDKTGWLYIGQYDATSPVQIDLSEFLQEGEYLTELALCYGAVEKDFSTVEGTPLTYLVKATHALSVGTVIPNTATSHISRNWAKTIHTPQGDVTRDEPDGLTDDDTDSVETRVIDTFTTNFDTTLRGWGSSWAKTSEQDMALVITLLLVGCVAIAGVALRRKKD